MTLFWLILFIAAAVLELATLAMVSIWFAAGALAALICALLGAGVAVQLLVFAVCSILTLVLFRIKGERLTRAHSTPTNADRVIGREGRVLKTIDNRLEEGLVAVDGQEWTARSERDGEKIPAGELVIIKRIDGVKLIVEALYRGKKLEGSGDSGERGHQEGK